VKALRIAEILGEIEQHITIKGAIGREEVIDMINLSDLIDQFVDALNKEHMGWDSTDEIHFRQIAKGN